MIAVGMALVGCASPRLEEKVCGRAPREILDVLQERVEGGTLRNGAIRMSARNGFTFVSAELHLAGDPPDIRGDVLTWATGDATGDEFFAVDIYARESSSWPAAPFDVREDGAIDSRGCVSYWSGHPEEVKKTVEGGTDDSSDLGF